MMKSDDPREWGSVTAAMCDVQVKIDLRGKVDRLQTALGYAREKLGLYRAQHAGNYVGGIEYTALIKMIDASLGM